MRVLGGTTLLGLMAGLLLAVAQPRTYVASVTVYFPSVQPQLFLHLTQALRSNPAGADELPNLSAGNPEVSQMAMVIFRSQAATEFALKQSGQEASAAWKLTDPVEDLQKQLEVTTTDPSTVIIRLHSRSGNLARLQVQGLLDYYTDFVDKNALTRVKKTRQKTEERLAKLVKYLRLLEHKMSRSSSKELRSLGDASIRANPKVMTQVWLRRMDEEGRGRELLNKLQKVRGNARPGQRPEDAWIAEWAQGQKSNPRPSPGLQRPVRRQDLLERAQLEREYYESLLKHRSLVLQHSFLLTWESLESSQFDIVDPLNVRSQRTRPAYGGLVGAGLGLLVGLLLSLRRKPRRR